MSWELMLAARHWDVSPVARHVGSVIASHANRAGLAWPSLETIAAETGWSRRAVMKAVREIEGAGVLVVIQRTGHSSEYQFAQSYPQLVRNHPADPGTTCTDPGTLRPNPGTTCTQKNKEELCKEESGLSTGDLTPATQIPANVANIRGRLKRAQ
jgi:biotin operon repressor